jgi:hypothetical protein
MHYEQVHPRQEFAQRHSVLGPGISEAGSVLFPSGAVCGTGIHDLLEEPPGDRLLCQKRIVRYWTIRSTRATDEHRRIHAEARLCADKGNLDHSLETRLAKAKEANISNRKALNVAQLELDRLEAPILERRAQRDREAREERERQQDRVARLKP